MELIILGITNIATIITAALLVRQERARYDSAVEAGRAREDKLMDRVQAPQIVAAQSIARDVEGVDAPPISAFDDEELAKYEEERQRLVSETVAMIEQYDQANGNA